MSDFNSWTLSERQQLLKKVIALPRRGRPKKPVPPFDLFGQVPVTYEECRQWVHAVAPRFYESRREDWYILNYGVPAKVAAWKVRGLAMPVPDARQSDPLGFYGLPSRRRA